MCYLTCLHLFISRDFYSDIRYDLFKNAADIICNFPAISDSKTLVFLMKNDMIALILHVNFSEVML